MITLIYGEDITASRNHYFELRQLATEPITLDGATVSPTDLQQTLSGDDLFGTSRNIFIENLISKRKSAKEIEILQNVLITAKTNIVLWESKELTKKQIDGFEKATVRQFKIPSIIFTFVDALQPNNGKKLLELYHEILQNKDPEFVLVMLQRQIRMLLALQDAGTEQISEVSRIAPWQRGKLERQARMFTQEELLILHAKLFTLEKNMKTGQLSQSLENEIDFLLVYL